MRAAGKRPDLELYSRSITKEGTRFGLSNVEDEEAWWRCFKVSAASLTTARNAIGAVGRGWDGW